MIALRLSIAVNHALADDGTFYPADAWSMPLPHRVREAGKVHFVTKQMNARRVVFSLLRAYFEMLKQGLSRRALNYSKQLDADLAATDALDHQRSGRPFPITPARIGAQLSL